MFKFDLNAQVIIKTSGERGEIRARAEYADGMENHYYIRYVTADGRATEAWWGESALV